MDRHSKTFTTPSGEVISLYYIGYFAKQVNRTTDCIRLWERTKIIPETPFRDKFGRRMYSQAQIDVVNKFLNKYNVGRGMSISSTYFSKNVFNNWNKLKLRYLGKG